MSKVSALYLESLRPEFLFIGYIPSVPFPGCRFQKRPRAVTTELSKHRENVNYIETKSLMNKVRWGEVNQDGYNDL